MYARSSVENDKYYLFGNVCPNPTRYLQQAGGKHKVNTDKALSQHQRSHLNLDATANCLNRE